MIQSIFGNITILKYGLMNRNATHAHDFSSLAQGLSGGRGEL